MRSDRRTCVLGKKGVGLIEVERETLSHVRELCDEIDGVAVVPLVTTAEDIPICVFNKQHSVEMKFDKIVI